MNIYVKSVNADSTAAMKALDALMCAMCATPSPSPGHWRCSETFPGERCCPIPSRRRRELSLRRRWCIEITCRLSGKWIRNWKKRRACSQLFPRSPHCRRPGFLDQVIGTALLLLLILAITDEFNTPPGLNLSPVMIGLVVVAIGMSYGGMHGYPITPARDFGPRLFTVLAGFRNNGLTDGTGSWWVPVVAPLLGGLVGAAVYDFGIRRFLCSS